MTHEQNAMGSDDEPAKAVDSEGVSADYWMGAYDAVMSLARQALHEWGRSNCGTCGDVRRTVEGVQPSRRTDGGIADDTE